MPVSGRLRTEAASLSSLTLINRYQLAQPLRCKYPAVAKTNTNRQRKELMFELYIQELLTMTSLTERKVQIERTRDNERGFELIEPMTPFTEFIAPY